MKRRKSIYWTDAADWIACNDDSSVTDLDEIAGSITVAMVADLSGIPALTIAQRVVDRRTIQADAIAAITQHLK